MLALCQIGSLLCLSASPPPQRPIGSAGDLSRRSPAATGVSSPSPRFTDMMDAAAEDIPHHRFDIEQIPCVPVAAGAHQHSSASMLVAVSKVLDDDDLLREILVRVGFPTTLVCAALTCKRWYHHASDRKFLDRFRERHPPCLLGFYVDIWTDPTVVPRFFPVLPQPTELDAICSHASFSLDTLDLSIVVTDIIGCLNGSVLVSFESSNFTAGVHSPLRPERGLAVIPPSPPMNSVDGYSFSWMQLLAKEEGDGLSYIELSVGSNKGRTKSMVNVDTLGNGDVVWRRHLTLATEQFIAARWEPKPVLADDKIYIPSARSDIFILDLTASSISRIQLPQGVEYCNGDTMLARADDASGLYLVHVKEFQLRIWLHKAGNWLLTNTICLRDMVANLRMPGCKVEDEPTAPLRMHHVGDYAEFSILEMGGCALYLDIKYKKLRKLYDMTETEQCFGEIHPFMMIWPPRFPVLKDDRPRNAK